jgi:predicted protein tyrosine phosphatase
MKIVVSSAIDLKYWILTLEKYELSYAIISISEPGERSESWSAVNNSLSFIDENCQGILALDFYDVEQDFKYLKTITEEDAINAVDFLLEMEDKVDYLICQCAAGISRSSGMAAGLLEVMGRDSKEIFTNHQYFPNRTVYKTIKSIGCYDQSY